MHVVRMATCGRTSACLSPFRTHRGVCHALLFVVASIRETSFGLAAQQAVGTTVDEQRPGTSGHGIATRPRSLQSWAPAPSVETRSPQPAPPVETRYPQSDSTFLWVAYLLLGTAFTCLFYLFPAYSSPLWAALGLSSVVATVIGVRRYRPRQPLAW